MALAVNDLVDAALGLLDEYGFADLSMRAIASKLGVQPGALYYHVPNKQSLLALLAREIVVDVGGASVAEWALSLRSALLAHRDAGELVAAAFAMREVDLLKRPIELFALSGLSRAEAAAAAVAVFVLGHTVDEQSNMTFAGFGVGTAESGFDERFSFGLTALLRGLGV